MFKIGEMNPNSDSEEELDMHEAKKKVNTLSTVGSAWSEVAGKAIVILVKEDPVKKKALFKRYYELFCDQVKGAD